MLTEYIKPVQLIAIKIPVIDKIIIFLDELKRPIKSLISFKKKSKINSSTKDHKPLCIATSNEGMYFI